MLTRLTVRLKGRSYPIWFGRNALSKLDGVVRSSTRARHLFLLSSAPIHRLYGGIVGAALRKVGILHTHLMPDGEKAKNEKTLFRILSRMADSGLHRDACVVALGGGVVGDMGGLAAALYMRGVDVIQVPTTLLAQVDASVGGKTAIDFKGVKNLVGAFHQPKAVFVDTSVLSSLPDRIYRSGLAEVVKHGMIADARYFAFLEKEVSAILEREPVVVARMVRRSVEIKSSIVAADEREKGVRAHLNFGHTLGHSLEAACEGWGLQHGEAVAFGMVLSSRISWKSGWCTQEVPLRLERLLRALGHLGKLPPLDPQRLFRLLTLDKKAKNGKTQFVLTRKIGIVSMSLTVPKRLIFWALRSLNSPFHEKPGSE